MPDDVFFAHQRRSNARFYLNPSRLFRLLRDYPKPLSMMYYLPTYLERLAKGLGRSE
jgi:hypothetical protein